MHTAWASPIEGSTALSTRFLSSVSTKKCLDDTKAWSWIIARMSTDTDTLTQKVHKYLDHCTCNEHEEKNILGLHGAVDRLLLTDHHIQLDFQKKRSENGLLLFGANYISNYLWHQRALSLLLSFLRTLPHSTHFTPSLSIFPLRWKLYCKSHWEWSEHKSEENRPPKSGPSEVIHQGEFWAIFGHFLSHFSKNSFLQSFAQW